MIKVVRGSLHHLLQGIRLQHPLLVQLPGKILSVSDGDLARKLDEKRAADKEKVLQKDAALQREILG